MKRIRLRDIAQQAQCAVATVSMALNHNPEIPQATRDRIHAIAREMGYVPNSLAKSLSLGKTGVLGVIMPFSIDVYYGALLDTLNVEAAEQGYEVHIRFHRWCAKEEEKALRRLVEYQVDGIVLYPAGIDYRGTEIDRWLKTLKIPVVAISRLGQSIFTPGVVDYVHFDPLREGELLGAELLKLGHTDIDLLEYGFSVRTQEQRREGILKAAQSLGKKCTVRIFNTPRERNMIQEYGFSPADYEGIIDETVRDYLATRADSTVMITGCCHLGWRTVNDMRISGARCPEDFSVAMIGFSGTASLGARRRVALEYNTGDVARQVITAIRNRIDKLPSQHRISLVPSLIPGNTELATENRLQPLRAEDGH